MSLNINLGVEKQFMTHEEVYNKLSSELHKLGFYLDSEDYSILDMVPSLEFDNLRHTILSVCKQENLSVALVVYILTNSLTDEEYLTTLSNTVVHTKLSQPSEVANLEESYLESSKVLKNALERWKNDDLSNPAIRMKLLLDSEESVNEFFQSSGLTFHQKMIIRKAIMKKGKRIANGVYRLTTGEANDILWDIFHPGLTYLRGKPYNSFDIISWFCGWGRMPYVVLRNNPK